MKTIFRKFKDGDVVAFFPREFNGRMILSYQHIGQHSDAHPDLVEELEPATPAEYAPLLAELQSIGYTGLEIADHE